MDLGGVGNAENWEPTSRVRIPAEELRPGDKVLYPGAGSAYSSPVVIARLVFDEDSDQVELWPGPWRIRRSTLVWVDPNRPLPVEVPVKKLGAKGRKKRA